MEESKSRAEDGKKSTAHPNPKNSLQPHRRLNSSIGRAKTNSQKGLAQFETRLQDEDKFVGSFDDFYDSDEELDPFGEQKITPSGELTGERQFMCPVFRLESNSGTGDLYMMGSDCASAIANAIPERPPKLSRWWNANVFHLPNAKEGQDFESVEHERGVIKALAAFRAFGHLVVRGGQPVHDDYFELDARENEFKNQKASQHIFSEGLWNEIICNDHSMLRMWRVTDAFFHSMRVPLGDVSSCFGEGSSNWNIYSQPIGCFQRPL